MSCFTQKKYFIYSCKFESVQAMDSSEPQKSNMVKIFTQFYRPFRPDCVPSEFLLAKMHLIYECEGYFGLIYKNMINSEINWTYQSIDRLEDDFGGRNNCAHLKFCFQTQILSFSTSIHSKYTASEMKIQIFELHTTKLPQSPFQIIRNLVNRIKGEKERQLSELRQHEERMNMEIQFIQQHKKQIYDIHDCQMAIMQDKFISLANNAKQKLRQQFNSFIDLQNQQMERAHQSQVGSHVGSDRILLKIKSDNRNNQKVEKPQISFQNKTEQQILYEIL